MATLYVVATPIGNLEDISQRALRTLSEVDFILCEDTRVTKKLLNYYNLRKPLISYHQHSRLKKVNYILELLREDKDLALVSDAGTPGVSDPGNELISIIFNHFRSGVKIVSIPGPSAVITAASISGFPMDKFVFMGFPPVKHKRTAFFEEIVRSKYPVIFYESPYKILKTLNNLSEAFYSFLYNNEFSNKDKNFNLQIVVCRELTKKFETVYRGEINEVIQSITNSFGNKKIKGEFTIVVEKCNN